MEEPDRNDSPAQRTNSWLTVLTVVALVVTILAGLIVIVEFVGWTKNFEL